MSAAMTTSPPFTRRQWTLAAGGGLLTSTLLGILFACTEKIPVAEGFGYDGVVYGFLAVHWDEAWAHGLDSYFVQRVLPSLLVHLGLAAGNAPRVAESAVQGFVVLNALALGIAAAAWVLVAAHWRLSRPTTVFGWVAMFGAFWCLKYTAYYPVLTDPVAFALGMLSLLCYLRGLNLALFTLSLAGAFTWPTAIPFALILLSFPCAGPSPLAPAARPARLPAAAFAGVYLLMGIWLWMRLEAGRLQLPSSLDPVWRTWFPLGLVLGALYCYWGASRLLAGTALSDWRRWLAALSPRGLALALVLVAVAVLQQRMLAARTSAVAVTGFFERLDVTVATSAAKPGVFLVAHVVFLGPLVLLAIPLWDRVCHAVRREGPGAVLAALLALSISVCSESRSLANIWPAAAAFTLRAVDSVGWRPRHYLLASLAVLISSQAWLVVAAGPTDEDPLRYPMQALFRQVGPWMTSDSYLMWLTVWLPAAALLLPLMGTATAETAAAPGRAAATV
jgi:hypothetical protein